MTRTLFISTLLLATAPLAEANSEDFVKNLLGTYQSRQTIPVVWTGEMVLEEGGGTTVKIAPVKGSTSAVKLEVSSVQSNAHSCELEGVANVVGNKLVLTEKIEDIGECVLEVSRVEDSLSIDDKGGVCRKYYCGARAGLDITVPLNSKIAPNGASQTSLLPAEGQSLCFDRDYGTAHLEKNPKQLISTLSVKITYDSDSGIKYVSLRASDRGEEFKTYGNAGACHKLSKGSGACALDSDSGQFSLQNNSDGSVYLKTANGVTLFEEAKAESQEPDVENPLSAPQLSLSDADNSIFKLYPSSCSYYAD